MKIALLALMLAALIVPAPAVAQDGFEPYPAGTETGIAHVDAAIRAALAGDAAALGEMLEFTDRPCVPGGGIGEVACPEGVEAGTPVATIAVSDC